MRITFDLTRSQIEDLKYQLGLLEQTEQSVLHEDLLSKILQVTSVLDSPLPIGLSELREKVGMTEMHPVTFGRHLSAISDELRKKRVFRKSRNRAGVIYYIYRKETEPVEVVF